jgi:hypothetical protein
MRSAGRTGWLLLLRRDVADLVDDEQRNASEAGEFVVETAFGVGVSSRRSTHSAAVAKATRWPAWQARMPSPMARCVLPVPGGPRNTTFLASVVKSKVARSAMASRLIERWKP